jgi:sirohydrochlorin cobaltochelatase
MTKHAVLMVGHGSGVQEAVEEFHAFGDALSERLGRPVDRCFLELVDPDIATGLSSSAQIVGEGGEVVVLPLFLGAAGHQKNDVASSIQWAREQFPGVRFRYASPLGPHAKLVQLLDLRVRECLDGRGDALAPGDTGVLVVGRGSSDPSSNGDVAKTAHMLFEKRPYLAVEHAFQAVARPTVEEGIRRCKSLGAKQVVVVPFILFTGKVDEDIRRVSERTGKALTLSVLQADYLGVHDLLLEVAQQRLQEAIDGMAAMNCDLCKYRFPMAGYERQVGLPQTTHHLHGGSTHDHGQADVQHPDEHDEHHGTSQDEPRGVSNHHREGK